MPIATVCAGACTTRLVSLWFQDCPVGLAKALLDTCASVSLRRGGFCRRLSIGWREWSRRLRREDRNLAISNWLLALAQRKLALEMIAGSALAERPMANGRCRLRLLPDTTYRRIKVTI